MFYFFILKEWYLKKIPITQRLVNLKKIFLNIRLKKDEIFFSCLQNILNEAEIIEKYFYKFYLEH